MCLVGGFMVLLDVSIVNVALPSIEAGLGARQSELQWVVSGYALTFGLLLVPAGRLGDLRGRRVMFVAALAAFTLASAACGAAQSSLWLVLARLVQGLAGGTLTPQISASIQELFSGAERGRAFGLFGATVGLSPRSARCSAACSSPRSATPRAGGSCSTSTCRSGSSAMPLAWKLLPGRERGTTTPPHDYDPVGVVLLGAGAVLLLLPFVQEREWGGASWLLVPLALAVLAAFLAWERRYTRHGHEPVVDLALFRLRSYALGTSLITVYFAGFTSLFFIFTLYLQVGLGYSALDAGLAITPFALGSGVAAALGGRIVSRVGRPLVVLGLALVAGRLRSARSSRPPGPGAQHRLGDARAAVVAGVGGGLVIAPNQALTLDEVPVQRAGTAGGLLQTGQRLGAAIGIAAVGSVFFTRCGSRRGLPVRLSTTASRS